MKKKKKYIYIENKYQLKKNIFKHIFKSHKLINQIISNNIKYNLIIL